MKAAGYRVRAAAWVDATGVAALSEQLGYLTEVAAVRARIELLGSRQDQTVLVAIDAAGAAIGYVQIGSVDYIYHESFGEIMGLIVDVAHRGSGVGRLLMEAAERWAQERGLKAISLRSNVIRTAAHAFYEKLGYDRAKTQYTFRKSLDGPPD